MLYRYFQQRRWLLLLVALALLGGASLALFRLQPREDLLALLPQKDPFLRNYQLSLKKFQALGRLLIDVHLTKQAPRKTSPDRLLAFADQLVAALRKTKDYERISYQIKPELRQALFRVLSSDLPGLFLTGDKPQLAALLTPQHIKKQITEAVRLLTSLQGLFVKKRVLEDPLGLRRLALEKLRFLEAGLQTIPYQGRLLSRDRRHLLIVAQPRVEPMNLAENARLQKELGQTIRRLEERFGGRVSAFWIGGHRSSLDNSRQLQRDISLTVTASLLAILLLFLLVFRHRLFVLLALSPALFGALLAVGTMALFRRDLSIIPLAFGAVLLGIAVDYAIHLCYHFEHHKGSMPDLLHRLRPGMILAAITSMAAFGVLLLARFRGQHLLATFALLGIGFALCFTLIFLPHLLDRFAHSTRKPTLQMEGLFARIDDWRSRHARLIVLLVLLLSLAALPGLWMVRFEGDMYRLNGVSDKTRQLEARFHRIWGNPGALASVVVRAPTPQQALQHNDRIFGVLRRLQEQGKLEVLSSFAPLWPARQTRQNNRPRWRRFWTPQRLQQLRQHLQQAAETHGLRAQAFQPFFTWLQQSLSPPASPPNLPLSRPQPPAPETKPPAPETKPASQPQSPSPQRKPPASQAKPPSSGGQSPSSGTKPPSFRPKPPASLSPEERRVRDFLLRERVRQEPGRVFVLTLLRPAPGVSLAAIEKELRPATKRFSLLSSQAFVAYIMRLVQQDFSTLFWVALAVVLLLLLLGFLHLDMALTALLPLALSLLWTMGLVGWSGLRLNLMNILVAALIFGLGVDYSVFFIRQYLQDRLLAQGHLSVAAGAISISALTTLFGLGALVLAGHPLLFSVGLTALVGIGSTLLATLFVMPLLLQKVVEKGRIAGPLSLKIFLGTLLGFGWFMGWLLLLRPYLWFLQRQKGEEAPRALRRILQRLCYLLMRYFPYSQRFYLDRQDELFEKPAIIVSNHQSQIDIPLVLGLPTDLRMLIKRWVWKFPIIGPMVQMAQMIDVPSSKETQGPEYVLERGKEALAEGSSVQIFPEGTRSADGRLRRFRAGAFRLASETGADILPVVIYNSYRSINKHTLRIADHDIFVQPCPRITPENFPDFDDPRQLRDHTRQVIANELEALAQQYRQDHPVRSRLEVCRRYTYLGPYTEQYVYWKLRLDPILSVVEPHLPQRGQILDLGCGYGMMAHFLTMAQPQRHVLGLDYDEAKISAARASARNSHQLHFDLQDLLSWEPDSTYDAVLLIDVLHYWLPQQQDQILARCAQALRPGGTFLMREVHRSEQGQHRLSAWTERFSTLFGFNQGPGKIHFRTASSIEETLRSLGLEVSQLSDDMADITSNVIFLCHRPPQK